MDGRETELLNKLVLEILNVALLRADLEGFGLCSLEVLLLTNGGHEADDIVAFLNEPGENA